MFEFFRSLTQIVAPVFVIATMLNVGLTQKPADILKHLNHWPFVPKMLLGNFVLVPLVAFLFQAPLLSHPFWLSAVLLTGTIGFSAVGTLFSAMLVRARSRDVLLPVLLYPITVPVIIAGVRATAALLQPDVELALVRFWVMLLLAIDVVFVTLALWTFEPLMTD